MKTIKPPLERGQLLCSPSFADRTGKLNIGTTPAHDIMVAMLNRHRPGSVERYGERVAIECGTHRAWIRISSNISRRVFVDFTKWEQEPILSLFPVIVAAMILWQRAHSATDLTGDDIVVDGLAFNGLLPIVVAAAARNTTIFSSVMPDPEKGIQGSVARLLAVDVSTKAPD